MSRLTIRALGSAEVTVDGQPAEWESVAARDLLFYLLAYPEGRTREDVLEDLWGVAPGGSGNTRFRVTLHRLRAALGDVSVVTERFGRLVLSEEVRRASDVYVFTEGMARAAALDPATDAVKRRAALLGATAAYRGALLPAVRSTWAHEAREELRLAYARASIELAVLHCAAAQCVPALSHLALGLKADPYLGENYHQDLMSCLSVVETRYAAVEHYRRYLRFLRDDLEDSPMTETVDLAERLKTGLHVCPRRIGTDVPCDLRVPDRASA